MSVELTAEKVSVLVVDDSADQRMLMGAHFTRAGCSVVLASTAAEALDECALHVPELVVIDLVLPVVDGWELVDRVRALIPGCPIAVTSVLREDRYPEADANLPKPFTGAAIRGVLERCVPRWAAA